MKLYVLLEHEPTSEMAAVCLGVFSTPALRQAARDARVQQIRDERPGTKVYGVDDCEDDFDIDLIEEDVTLDDVREVS